MISFLIRVAAIGLGLALIVYLLYLQGKYNIPWTGGGRHTHVKGFPWDWFLVALALIAWALGDLWLYGGPKARRQAELDAQRQAQEASTASPEAPEPSLGKSEEQTGQTKPEQRRD